MMRKMFSKNTCGVVTLLLVLVTVSCGLILGAAHSNADSATASVTVGSACTMTATVDTAHTAEIPGGTTKTDIGSTTLNTICNDAGGYAIYAVGYSGDEYGNNKMLNGTNEINTGTGSSASNWNMSLSQVTTGTYATTIDGGFGSYSAIPATYTKVAHRDSMTDSTTGSSISLTYGAYVASTQAPGDYVGKVKFTMVHPATEIPLAPQTTEAGCIRYYPNGGNVEGTMGCQPISASDTSVVLLASNYSREGYGFAGWSTTYDYSDNTGFLGPQEDITFTAGQYTGSNNGLSLYAYWIKSAGNLQGWTGCSNMTSGAVTALTDQRDGETYAVAKLADGNCWMIENLRLDNTAELTLANTNNPLNDGTNVTLKHNYTDTDTYDTLSATSSVAYNADTTPDGWCTSNSATCDDQSRLRTDNTTNRATNPTSNSGSMYSYGNYYNWYSATAGRGTYGFNTNNNSVAGDLCPAGWHLPKGGNKSNEANNEFWALVVTGINGGANPANYDSSTTPYYTGSPEGVDASNALRAYPNNFVYSGLVNSGSMSGRGSRGLYWSSTAYSSVSAYYLNFYSSDVYPGTYYGSKYFGWAIRCLALGT